MRSNRSAEEIFLVMEKLCISLREALRGRELFDHLQIQSGYLSSTPIKHFLAANETEKDYLVTFRWARQNQTQYGMTYLFLDTDKRLLFKQELETIFKACVGHPVNFQADSGWHWDSDGKSWRPSGASAFARHYRLMVSLSDIPFSESDIPKALAAWDWMCTSKDIRADRCVFEQIEEAGIDKSGGGSYVSHPGGFYLNYYRKSMTEPLLKLFEDCQLEQSSTGRGKNTSWTLKVTYPDMISS